jgi:broad specificity phosphatase PhoE
MPRIVLVRHGQTDWNVAGRTQGWNDQPLNAEGQKQAKLAGDYLRSRFAGARVWSSDLSRCVQTAATIGAPVTKSPELRELKFGQWEGRLWTELHRESPELAAKFVAGDPAFRAPGGEALGELVERARRFVEASGVVRAEGDTVLVSHGGTLRCLIVALLGLPAESVGRFHCGNASVSVIASTPANRWRLELLNGTSHLEAGA